MKRIYYVVFKLQNLFYERYLYPIAVWVLHFKGFGSDRNISRYDQYQRHRGTSARSINFGFKTFHKVRLLR